MLREALADHRRRSAGGWRARCRGRPCRKPPSHSSVADRAPGDRGRARSRMLASASGVAAWPRIAWSRRRRAGARSPAKISDRDRPERERRRAPGAGRPAATRLDIGAPRRLSREVELLGARAGRSAPAPGRSRRRRRAAPNRKLLNIGMISPPSSCTISCRSWYICLRLAVSSSARACLQQLVEVLALPEGLVPGGVRLVGDREHQVGGRPAAPVGAAERLLHPDVRTSSRRSGTRCTSSVMPGLGRCCW